MKKMALIVTFLVMQTSLVCLSAETKKENQSEGIGDYFDQKPGKSHKISVDKLAAPLVIPPQEGNFRPSIVSRPKNVWPQVPAGFQVQLYAENLDNPRILQSAPNGDIFLAESNSGKIKVLRGLAKDGKAKLVKTFAIGLNKPYGIAFYPLGKSPQWVYVANTDSIVRFSYTSGDLEARNDPQKIIELPHANRGHWSRDIQFSLDGQRLYVTVGSLSNIDDPDEHAYEKDRATIWSIKPDGSDKKIYAWGIRHATSIATNPRTGDLWCSANERDYLGDNLVPDYLTKVEENGFYGWPWWYMGGNQDPRHKGKHPELRSKVIVPDVLLPAHHATLGMTFYTALHFPNEYRGNIFASQHGSWNRSVLSGYEVIRVRLDAQGKSKGEYEDFMTGFVLNNKEVWGRPVGVCVAADGALLVSDDGSNSIWRISYAGKSQDSKAS